MKKERFLEIVNCLKSIISGTKWDNHVFAVGGCCRDYMAGRNIKDIDLVVDLPNGGIEFAEWLESEGLTKGSVVTYPHFGTAMFHLNEIPDIELEAVQTRKECYRDIDTRNPDTAFGTIDDDCTRRDFTYNAIYYNISNGGFCDYNGNSFNDLKANILRTCGDPDVIFTEDPLRILRAIRFTCRFDSKIDEKTLEGMKKYADRLEIISKERIQDEFSKMITSKHPDLAIKLIFETGAYKYVFGDLRFGYSEVEYLSKSIPKAFERLKNIEDAEQDNLEINLAIVYSFLSCANDRMKFLKYSNDIINKVSFYLDIFEEINFLQDGNAALRALQYKAKTFENLFNSWVVYMAVMNMQSSERVISDSKEMIEKGQDMFGYKLPIDGEDVMRVLNIGPSEKVKRYLNLVMGVAYLNPFISKSECEEILKCN